MPDVVSRLHEDTLRRNEERSRVEAERLAAIEQEEEEIVSQV